MSTAREAILGAIRGALGRTAPDAATRQRLDARLASPTPNLQPALEGDVTATFAAQAKSQSMTLARVPSPDQVPAAVARYIEERKLPPRVAVAPALRALPWPAALEVRAGPAGRDDPISVTPCFAAVAESGSVVLLSGPATPTTLNFVPDDHIVVLEARRIVRHQEDVWRLLREECASLPRTVNLVSGPSRTADIEQVVQLGVHGPRRVHILLVEGAP